VLSVLKLASLSCAATVGPRTGETLTPDTGLAELAARNDRTAVDPTKPFEPFGDRPKIGARLSLADPELAGKRLTRLDLALEWMGVPGSLATHYAGYASPPQNGDFKAEIAIVDRGVSIALSTERLFEDDAGKRRNIALSDFRAVTEVPPGPPRGRAPDSSRWDRYLRLELAGSDFRHAAYPKAASTAAEGTTVNPPHNPRLKSLGSGYRAESQWSPAQGLALDPGEAILHLHPFGQSPAGEPGAEL